MNIRPISELALYRYRYVIGYALIAILIAGLLVLNVQSVPAGMSPTEQTSALASSQLRLNFHVDTIGQDILTFLQNTNAVDLPYHLLQRASIEIFGLSPFGVRLPSLLLAAASGFMLLTLLRRWLRPNAALVMGLVLVTTSWFLSLGRLGTPDVMIVFWTTLILLLATLISQEVKYYQGLKVLTLISIAFSLYTPYTVYLFAAALLGAMTQPHLRYVIRYAEKASISIGFLLFVLILIPHAYSVWRDPGIIGQLLAIPTDLPDPLDFLKNLLTSLGNLINPFHVALEQHALPLISIPTTAFAIIGFARLIKDWHSVRSHVLLVWAALLIPLLGLDKTHNLTVLFVPVMMLSAIGVQQIFQYWYTLFPRNPYARIFGLIPLSILIVSMISFNYQRYFIGLPYSETAAKIYNQDPFLLQQTLASKAYRDQRVIVIAPADKIELYKIDRAITKDLAVVTSDQFTPSTNATRVVVAESEFTKLTAAQRAQLPAGKAELLVTARKTDALRFRSFSTP